MVRVFLDANVYFAGSFSPTGASALILRLAKRRAFQLVASRLVLREAERNLRGKGTRKALREFRQVVQTASPRLVHTPSDRVLRYYESDIHPKDVPVLAAAVEASVDYLVTLDRRHFLTPAVRTRAGRVRVMAPGDFLKELVRHAGQ